MTEKNQHIPATDLAMRAFDDPERYEKVIERVDDTGNGWELRLAGGQGAWLSPKVPGHEPKAGDTCTIWGKDMLGEWVRGFAVDNIVYSYSTEEEMTARLRAESEEREATKRAAYENGGRDQGTAQIEALPEPFRRRMQLWRDRIGDRAYATEAYELFVCEQAALIADRFATFEEVAEFAKLPYAQQRESLPDLSDGHSGNTFGCACYLAGASKRTDVPQVVERSHMALCPLDGCTDAGCWSASAEAEEERRVARLTAEA